MMNGQPTIDGNQSMTITLPLIQWQQLVQGLIDAPLPWKVTNPLVTAYERKIQEIMQRQQTVEAPAESPQA